MVPAALLQERPDYLDSRPNRDLIPGHVRARRCRREVRDWKRRMRAAHNPGLISEWVGYLRDETLVAGYRGVTPRQYRPGEPARYAASCYLGRKRIDLGAYYPTPEVAVRAIAEYMVRRNIRPEGRASLS